MVTYLGHASAYFWAHEKLFSNQVTDERYDIENLMNNNKLPVVLELTCRTGYFINRTQDLEALDEHMLQTPEVGAVAIWGPTGWGIHGGHVKLAEGFFSGTYQGGNMDLGSAIIAGKLNLGSSYQDLLDTFTLLGDPALNLHLFTQTEVYLPIIIR